MAHELEEPDLWGSFHQPLAQIVLPPSLKSLILGRDFNEAFLQGMPLPEELQELTFGEKFQQPLTGFSLPSNLRSLTFGPDYNQSLEGVIFPNSILEQTNRHDIS